MITKSPADIHFTKNFGENAFSNRLILPGKDNCNVKVTRFVAKKGVKFNEIQNDTDETVYVESGVIHLTWTGSDDGMGKTLGNQDVYHVSAGFEYNLEVIADCVVVCVFSPSPGPLPDDK